MNRETFHQYLAAYDRLDYEALARHYTPDIVFETMGRRFTGRDAVLGFLKDLHDGMRDRMTPLTLLIDGNYIAMEADTEITALADGSLPVGVIKKGDRHAVRMFIFYRVEGDAIAHIKVAAWPPVDGQMPGGRDHG
jgi:ketosteroid isomerase-like protein